MQIMELFEYCQERNKQIQNCYSI